MPISVALLMRMLDGHNFTRALEQYSSIDSCLLSVCPAIQVLAGINYSNLLEGQEANPLLPENSRASKEWARNLIFIGPSSGDGFYSYDWLLGDCW